MSENKNIEISSKPIEIEVVLFDENEKLYLESSLGANKANYWTDDIKKAFVFTSVNEAMKVFKNISKNSDVQLHELIKQERIDL